MQQWIILIKIHEKFKLNEKFNKIQKTDNGLQNRRANRKNRNAGCNFIHRRNNENFFQLRRKIEESIRFKSDPEGNVVNLTAFLSHKVNVKLLSKNLDFTPTTKVYNKKKLDSNLNNLSRLIKLIIKHNPKTQLVEILTTKRSRLKQTKTKSGYQTKIIIY